MLDQTDQKTSQTSQSSLKQDFYKSKGILIWDGIGVLFAILSTIASFFELWKNEKGELFSMIFACVGTLIVCIMMIVTSCMLLSSYKKYLSDPNSSQILAKLRKISFAESLQMIFFVAIMLIYFLPRMVEERFLSNGWAFLIIWGEIIIHVAIGLLAMVVSLIVDCRVIRLVKLNSRSDDNIPPYPLHPMFKYSRRIKISVMAVVVMVAITLFEIGNGGFV